LVAIERRAAVLLQQGALRKRSGYAGRRELMARLPVIGVGIQVTR
jgi:hypothetical protein